MATREGKKRLDYYGPTELVEEIRAQAKAAGLTVTVWMTLTFRTAIDAGLSPRGRPASPGKRRRSG